MVSHELPFSITILHEDGSVVVKLAGELDIATRPVLREAVSALISPHLRAATLDLADVPDDLEAAIVRDAAASEV